MISKNQAFPDAPITMPEGHQYQPGNQFYCNGPRMHEFLKEINRKCLVPHNAITVGEMPCISDVDEIIRTVGSNSGELNMIFIFDIVDIDNSPGGPKFSTLRSFNARDIRRIQSKWQHAMIDHDGWNSIFVSNHDQPRPVSRYTDDSTDALRQRGAKLLALMQTTLAGTLFVYQGEELGMKNASTSWDIDTEYKDIESINFWQKSKNLYANNPEKIAEAQTILHKKARDHARTPMHWDDSPNAGFCPPSVKPWMRVMDDYKECNAARQLKEGDSVFHFWQMALLQRKLHKDVWVYGEYDAIGEPHDAIYAYTRTGKKSGKYLVVLNFSGQEVKWEIPKGCEVEMWTAGNIESEGKREGSGMLVLRPWEGVVGQCGV
jgi:oligo-1,6-glucosidase